MTHVMDNNSQPEMRMEFKRIGVLPIMGFSIMVTLFFFFFPISVLNIGVVSFAEYL